MTERESFDPQETSNQLLPKVNKDLAGAIMAEMREQGNEEFVVNLIRQIETENPTVSQFLANMGKLSKDTKMTMECGALVYELLRRQALADRMKKEFGQ